MIVYLYQKLKKNLTELLQNRPLRERYQQKSWENFKLSSALSSRKLGKISNYLQHYQVRN